MNATPHAHRLEVDPGLGIYTHLTYGDQRLGVDPDPPFYGWRLRRAKRKIVRRHDRHSRKAGRRAAIRQAVVAESVEFDPNEWGSKQLRRRETGGPARAAEPTPQQVATGLLADQDPIVRRFLAEAAQDPIVRRYWTG